MLAVVEIIDDCDQAMFLHESDAGYGIVFRL